LLWCGRKIKNATIMLVMASNNFMLPRVYPGNLFWVGQIAGWWKDTERRR
jgi:hypothetical protein